MTDPADDDFAVLVESAYAEPEVIYGVVGDDRLTPVTPSAPRPGVDRGTAGSLIQTLRRLRQDRRDRRDRRDQIGPPRRDAWTILVVLAVVAGVFGARWLVTLTFGPLWLLIIPLLLIAAAGVWIAYLRRGPAVGRDRCLE